MVCNAIQKLQYLAKNVPNLQCSGDFFEDPCEFMNPNMEK